MAFQRVPFLTCEFICNFIQVLSMQPDFTGVLIFHGYFAGLFQAMPQALLLLFSCWFILHTLDVTGLTIQFLYRYLVLNRLVGTLRFMNIISTSHFQPNPHHFHPLPASDVAGRRRDLCSRHFVVFHGAVGTQCPTHGCGVLCQIHERTKCQRFHPHYLRIRRGFWHYPIAKNFSFYFQFTSQLPAYWSYTFNALNVLSFLMIIVCAVKIVRYVNAHAAFSSQTKDMNRQLTMNLIILVGPNSLSLSNTELLSSSPRRPSRCFCFPPVWPCQASLTSYMTSPVGI
jgi:hypothetical protein